jgi:hypothetical protein
MTDGRMHVSAYMKAFVQEVDGKAWVLVCIASLVVLIDLLIGTKFVPIREKTDFGKAVVLLIFTPLLSFLAATMFRLMSSSSKKYTAWARAALCLGMFLILNF